MTRLDIHSVIVMLTQQCLHENIQLAENLSFLQIIIQIIEFFSKEKRNLRN